MKTFIINIAKQAGNLLMQHFGKIKYVKEKEGKSYFTNVDLASEKLIISAIKEKFPEHNIISEESRPINNNSDYTWYIDPLDGTHNYINNFPLFGVSIGLTHKNKIVLGVINLPYFNELYFAEKGVAYVNGRKLMVSEKKDIRKSFVLTELQLRNNMESRLRIFKKLNGNVYDLRAIGSAVYAYAMVARGNADVFLGPRTNPWDTVAGALLVKNAGGKVTNLAGATWNVNHSDYIASNNKFHDELVEILK